MSISASCARDPDIKPFGYPDKLVAWAVKYAEEKVFVVCETTWRPSSELLAYGDSIGIKIVRSHLSDLAPELVERMRNLHFISTDLKKHPEKQSILERFVPDF